jgi:predicted PhzF superfamily epimerase YddE/YHI9
MMKKYKYIKSNAFTAGALLGNPAACVFTGKETLSPEQMQAVARYCEQNEYTDNKRKSSKEGTDITDARHHVRGGGETW